MKARLSTLPPRDSTSLVVALAVPPVASRSSTMMTFWPGDRVFVDFERVLSVLEVVGHAGDFGGKLLGLAHGNEAGVKAIGKRGSEDESAGFDAEDEVNLAADEAMRQFVDEHGEADLVLQQGGDVVEEDAGFRKVGYTANQFL